MALLRLEAALSELQSATAALSSAVVVKSNAPHHHFCCFSHVVIENDTKPVVNGLHNKSKSPSTIVQTANNNKKQAH
jgi:hypothetical protein